MKWDEMATEFVVFCIENTATRLGISVILPFMLELQTK